MTLFGSAQWASISARSGKEVLVALGIGFAVAAWASTARNKSRVLGFGGIVIAATGIALLMNAFPVGIYLVTTGSWAIAINGLRPWGDGLSINQINDVMKR